MLDGVGRCGRSSALVLDTPCHTTILPRFLVRLLVGGTNNGTVHRTVGSLMLLAEGCHARASKGAVVVISYIYNINERLSPFAERASTWMNEITAAG